MDDLVSGVLTRIAEIQDREVDVLVGRRMATSSGAEAGRYRLRCTACGTWTVEGTHAEIDAAAAVHVQGCGEPTRELRLCRAHRQIVEQYQRAQDLLSDDRFTGSVAECNKAAARSLRVAVEALAVGLGVVEEDR